jgi:hypothetical protein
MRGASNGIKDSEISMNTEDEGGKGERKPNHTQQQEMTKKKKNFETKRSQNEKSTTKTKIILTEIVTRTTKSSSITEDQNKQGGNVREKEGVESNK